MNATRNVPDYECWYRNQNVRLCLTGAECRSLIKHLHNDATGKVGIIASGSFWDLKTKSIVAGMYQAFIEKHDFSKDSKP